MHNPIMNHKSAWAEENRSPKAESSTSGVRRIIVQDKPISSAAQNTSELEEDILIVASKLKHYIKNKFDMNTSASVMDLLSNQVRRITDQAAERAKRDGRKTIMDRDF